LASRALNSSVLARSSASVSLTKSGSKTIDLLDGFVLRAQNAFVMRAEKLAGEGRDHLGPSINVIPGQPSVARRRSGIQLTRARKRACKDFYARYREHWIPAFRGNDGYYVGFYMAILLLKSKPRLRCLRPDCA